MACVEGLFNMDIHKNVNLLKDVHVLHKHNTSVLLCTISSWYCSDLEYWKDAEEMFWPAETENITIKEEK